MNEAEWVKIDPSEFNHLRTEKVGGVDTEVALSPHDVPTAFRSRLDKSHEVLVIDFRYLDDEGCFEVEQQEGVIVRLGHHSKRLMGVVVPFAFVSKRAGLQITWSGADGRVVAKAVESFEKARESQPWAARMRDSYDTVRKVLQEKFVAPAVGAF